MAMTKLEAAKLTQDLLLRGVIETLVKESQLRVVVHNVVRSHRHDPARRWLIFLEQRHLHVQCSQKIPLLRIRQRRQISRDAAAPLL